jgi:hypothetical protein
MWKRYSHFAWCFLLAVGVCRAQTTPSSPTAELLQQLIRINTSNPPGNEIQLDEFLAAKLKPLGFETEIIPTPDAGKAHFIARLKGNGSRRPILLQAFCGTDMSMVAVHSITRDPWRFSLKP